MRKIIRFADKPLNDRSGYEKQYESSCTPDSFFLFLFLFHIILHLLRSKTELLYSEYYLCVNAMAIMTSPNSKSAIPKLFPPLLPFTRNSSGFSGL